MATTWKAVAADEDLFEDNNRVTSEPIWSATHVDLVFGSNSERHALAEVYAAADSEERFIHDFCSGMGKGDEPGSFRYHLNRATLATGMWPVQQ
jgi:catalase-peroxidase